MNEVDERRGCMSRVCPIPPFFGKFILGCAARFSICLGRFWVGT